LPQRHNSVLSRGNSRYAVIGRVAFVAHMAAKATGASDSPPYLLLFDGSSGF
jgi:hypothetical protein